MDLYADCRFIFIKHIQKQYIQLYQFSIFSIRTYLLSDEEGSTYLAITKSCIIIFSIWIRLHRIDELFETSNLPIVLYLSVLLLLSTIKQ